MFVRTAAGWALIATGTGLAAISGILAYHGFEAMIAIPFAGWIGPCVAASCIGLGIAVESEIRHRRWAGAAILGALLVSAGLLDRHSGELAMKEKVTVAEQSNADRLKAFETAVTAKADAEAIIADVTAKLAILEGDDVKAAQKLLGVPQDGAWGGQTTGAAQTAKEAYREELRTAREDVRKHTDVIALGVPVSDAAFTAHDAELYASLITLFSIILAFAGSYVAHGLQRNPEDELTAMEAQATELETEVFDLAAFLASRKEAA